MPSNAELNIVLKLLDQASDKLKKISGDLKNQTAGITEENKKLQKQSDATGKTMQEQFRESSKQLKDFRRAMYGVTAEIAFIGAAVKVWAEHNTATRDSLNELGRNMKNLFALVGSIFAPTIMAFNNLLKASMKELKFFFSEIQNMWTGIFKNISFGIQYVVAFIAALKETKNVMEAHKIALQTAGQAAEEMGAKFKIAFVENIPQVDASKTKIQEMGEALEKINMLYMDGQITAGQYYDLLTSKDVVAFQSAQMRMQLMQQEAQLSNLLNDQSLMNYKTTVEAKMNLEKTLISYSHTLYGSWFDFVNMGIQKFSTGMTSALTAVIMRTKTAGEAFKEFGLSLITAIVEFVIQYAIQAAIAAAIGKMVATATITQAGLIAAAWFPAALYASIATLGGAAGEGLAALGVASVAGVGMFAATQAAMAGAGAASGAGAAVKHQGGIIRAHSGLAVDEVPIIAQTGEGILSRRGMANLGGESVLNALNAGETTNFGDVNVNIYYPRFNSKEEANELIKILGIEIQRQLRYARSI
jgi:hypothetical protein